MCVRGNLLVIATAYTPKHQGEPYDHQSSTSRITFSQWQNSLSPLPHLSSTRHRRYDIGHVQHCWRAGEGKVGHDGSHGIDHLQDSRPSQGQWFHEFEMDDIFLVPAEGALAAAEQAVEGRGERGTTYHMSAVYFYRRIVES